MNKKVILSVFVILVVIAASLGATMAWFTFATEPIDNTFQAGTVEIEAGEVWAHGEKLENWNPGDCTDKEITVEVTGSKRVFIKADITETWSDLKDVDSITENVVFDADGNMVLANPSTETFTGGNNSGNPVKWVIEEEVWPDGEWTFLDGYWYFNGILDPKQDDPNYTPDGPKTIKVITQVCLDGPSADNKYQFATYDLEILFEAIQVTHEASMEMWDGAAYMEQYNEWHQAYLVGDNWQIVRSDKTYEWQVIDPANDLNEKGWVDITPAP